MAKRDLGNFDFMQVDPVTGHTHVSLRALNGVDPLIDALRRKPRHSSPLDVYDAERLLASGRTQQDVLQVMGSIANPWSVYMDEQLDAPFNTCTVQE